MTKRQKDRQTKKQKDRKTERQKDKTTKRQKDTNKKDKKNLYQVDAQLNLGNVNGDAVIAASNCVSDCVSSHSADGDISNAASLLSCQQVGILFFINTIASISR